MRARSKRRPGLAPAMWVLGTVLSVQPHSLNALPRTALLTEINSEANETAPFLSYDGLTMYFNSDRYGGSRTRIYEAVRASAEAPFGRVKQIRSAFYPWVSPDNLRLYCHTLDIPHGGRISVHERSSPQDSWTSLSTYLTEVNDLGKVGEPTLTRDELTIVFTAIYIPDGHGLYNLWTGSRTSRDTPFGNFRNLSEINSPSKDVHPRLGPDGLTLYFSSDRNGKSQIFRATRPSLDDPFGVPKALDFLDTPGGDASHPSPSPDGTTLYFVRQAEGGNADIHEIGLATFQGLGRGIHPFAISGDGLVVVGAMETDDGVMPFRWTQRDGAEVLPVPRGVLGAGEATSVSYAGRLLPALSQLRPRSAG